jgi:MSHA biogenesis protein MshG
MPAFQYSGRNRRGEAVNGRIEGASVDAVASQLFNNGITPIDILPADVSQDVLGALRGLRLQLSEGRVRLVDQIFFCRQMYTLLKAGVPIMQTLRGLRETTQNPALAKVIGSLTEGLDAGLDLTGALRRHPEVFPPVFVSMVTVGESTGNLPEAFLQLADYLEREKDTRERIKQAVRYPLFVIIAMAIALLIVNVFVIPAFAKVYVNLKVALPLPTRLLIGFSNFTVQYWYALVLGAIGGVVWARLYIRSPEGRYRWDRLKLRLPIIGGIIFRASLGRFARALSMTLRAGVPVVQGMTVIARAVDNEYIAERILQMRDGLERGESFARTAAATAMFPPLVLQMIAVGEESGAIDTLLTEVAGYYEREVDYDLKNLSSAIEPILLVAIGGLVLVLALGVFLPMWDLAAAFRSGGR